MTKLQEKILNTMKAFDQVCRENGLQYYMLGGTMLGAVRHQGFIPWDDDADFGLPRAEYEALLRLPEEKVPAGYRLRHFSKESGIPYAFARLEDVNTTYIEARRSGSGYVGGVYIDIFPLDEDSSMSIRQRWKEFRVNVGKKLLYAHIAETGAVKHPVKRWVMGAVTKHTSREKLVRKLDAMVKGPQTEGKRGAKCRYSNYLGHWGRKESVPYKVFGAKKEYVFEGMRFYGPADGTAYLTSLYGADYMVPPADGMRKGHPAKIMNLERSYLTYKK